MNELTISDDLARAISDAGPFVRLIDSNGRAVADCTSLDPPLEGPIGMTEEHIAEIKRRMAEDDGTRYTWAEVKEHLRSLAQE